MTLGSLNHLTLTVTDMARSAPFYNAVLGFMGYRQVDQTAEFVAWFKNWGIWVTDQPSIARLT